MIVVDASAAVEFFSGSAVGAQVGEALAGERRIVVPGHFDLEVYAAVARMVRRSAGAARVLERLVTSLARLQADRAELLPLLPHIHAMRGRLSPYDAPYVVLARELDLELLTVDARLAHAAGSLARIRLLSGASS